MDNQANIITVSGVSNVKVEPDQLEIEVTSTSSYDTSEKANNALLGNIRKINDILNRLQMNDVKAEVCTSAVNKISHDIYDKNRNVTGEKVAFEALLKVSIKMDIGRPSFEQLMKLIGKELPEAETVVFYLLKDPGEHTLRALASAVQNAKAKAAVIANACEYQLGDIIKITENCSCDNQRSRVDYFVTRVCYAGFGGPSNDNNSEPKKVLVSATVNITWSIDRIKK